MNRYAGMAIIAAAGCIAIASAPSQMTRVNEQAKLDSVKEPTYVRPPPVLHQDVKNCRQHWIDFIDLGVGYKAPWGWSTKKHYHDGKKRTTTVIGFNLGGIQYRATCWSEAGKIFDTFIGKDIT